MEKINIAELLKDCPKGMELDCIIYNNVEFEGISNNKDWPIAISVEGYPEVLNPYGCISYRDYTKCVIFPKGKTTWEGFVPPIQFRDGDIAATDCNCSESQLFIVSGGDSQKQMKCYVSLFEDGKLDVDAGNYYVTRYATEEEKEKLFDAIKESGYKWNAETETLEKLVRPKFDPKTLQPFDKILMRDHSTDEWDIGYFSYIKYDLSGFDLSDCEEEGEFLVYTAGGPNYWYAVPYNEDTKHLVGKVDEAPEYYRYWED